MSDQVDGRIQPAKEVRMIFSNVLEAKAVQVKGKPSGDPKFGGTFVVPADLIGPLKDKAIAVAKAKWPGRDLKTLGWPFTASEKEAAKAVAKGKDASIYPAGTIIVRARSKYQPQLAYLDERTVKDLSVQPADLALAKRLFYSGCYVVPEFNFVPYDGVGNNPDGVTAYLNAVLRVRDGDRIGGVNAAEAFKGYVGQITDEDPTAGASALDDEIPF